jgi:hypothetical protein
MQNRFKLWAAIASILAVFSIFPAAEATTCDDETDCQQSLMRSHSDLI